MEDLTGKSIENKEGFDSIDSQLDRLAGFVDTIEGPNLPELSSRIEHGINKTIVLSFSVSRSAKEKIKQSFKTLFTSICSLQDSTVQYKGNDLIKQQVENLLLDQGLKEGLMTYRTQMNMKNVCISLVHWTTDYSSPQYSCKQSSTLLTPDAVGWNIYAQFCSALGKKP